MTERTPIEEAQKNEMISSQSMRAWMRTAALSLIATSALTLVVKDYMQFRQLSEQGADVWYSSSWLRSPVTNFMLAGRDAKEFWQINAVGNERWHVREVRYEGTTFWTTLSREALPGN